MGSLTVNSSLKNINLDFFKELLIQKKQGSEKIIAEKKQVLQEANDGCFHLHLGENGNDNISFNEACIIINREDLNLKNIHLALERIKTGQYGICPKCGDPINQERLSYYPEGTYCVSCAKKFGS